MQILFLSHYFPPEVNAPATRTYEHCKEWVQEGHSVTVVTCAPNHPQGTIYSGYRNAFYQREERDGIKIIRIWTYISANEGFLKRTINYLSYMFMAIFLSPWLSKADIVVSTSPQFFNGLAGYFISWIKRAPWVLEIRDLWPESILVVGAITNSTIIRFLEWIELFAYRNADHIIPVTDSFRSYMMNKGIPSEKITVIKNGVNLECYDPHKVISVTGDDFILQHKFVASYVGTHGMAHHLETIIHAAQELQDYQDIHFLLVGDGAERQKLVELCQVMHLNNITMLEQQPKERMPHIWSLSDVSLVVLKNSDLFQTVIPSKIFESMAMKKPIVLGVQGESEDIIRSAQAGLCITPEDAKGLANATLELYKKPELCLRLGENGRRYVTQHFDRTRLAQRYSQILTSLL